MKFSAFLQTTSPLTLTPSLPTISSHPLICQTARCHADNQSRYGHHRCRWCFLLTLLAHCNALTRIIPGADKSLARPGRKQARKHVRDARDFNNIETRVVIIFFLQGKARKEIHGILTETLACFLPGRAKDLSAPLYFINLVGVCLGELWCVLGMCVNY